VLYNQINQAEKRFITVRINVGKALTNFYFLAVSKTTFVYNALEYRVAEFLQNVNAQWDVVIAATSLPNVCTYISEMRICEPVYLYLCLLQYNLQPLLFGFAYIVDMLVYMGTRDNVGENYLRLGSVLFRYVF
jgi:hypothetical protein